VFGAVSGVILLGEAMTVPIFAGIAVFFLAVVLVQLPALVRIREPRTELPAD
jgi:drug/metabolite transporter (DMT)-like permease